MEIYVKCMPEGLVPMYDSDLGKKKRLKEGEVYKVEVSIPRNYQFLKKFFALVRLTFDNLPERLVRMLGVRNEDDMLDCFKLDLGLFTQVWHGRRPIAKLRSISFAAMDETEFQNFYNRCVDIVLTKYLRGTTRQELIDEVEMFK